MRMAAVEPLTLQPRPRLKVLEAIPSARKMEVWPQMVEVSHEKEPWIM